MSLRILGPKPNRAQVRAERCRRSFAVFCQDAWAEVDPDPLIWTWHLQALCDHLQAVTEGRITRLVINVPPGHAKSMIVSVLWPAWVWSRRPGWRALFGSYALDLAIRDAVKSRTLIESDWYRRNFTRLPNGENWNLSGDQNVKSYYKNDVFGERLALSVAGKGTGFRGDAQVIDDPLNATDAHSALAREAVIRWFDQTMSSRLNDQATGAKVLIMQRLHEGDLSGHVLRAGGWDHLCLPSEYDPRPEARCDCWSCARGATSIGWRDPRKKRGDLLFPAKFPASVIAEARKTLGSYGYAGQHSQRPVPAGGGVFKRDWFSSRWRRPGEPEILGITSRAIDPARQKWDKLIMATDAAFKKTADSDRIAIGVWGAIGPDVFLLDLFWERATFTETVQAFLDLVAKWPRAHTKLIEAKANGDAVINVLKKKVKGILPVEPVGGKEARIHASAPFYETGNVYLPQSAPWVADFITEAQSFPRGEHDDGIDMAAYAILRLNSGAVGLEKLRALVKW